MFAYFNEIVVLLMRFLLCNIIISSILGLFLITRKLYQNSLSACTRYHLWFLLLGLLAAPFLPLRPARFPRIFSWLFHLIISPDASTNAVMEQASTTNLTETVNRFQDFTLSIDSKTPPIIAYVFAILWLCGFLAMILFTIRSFRRLGAMKKSALPLQNTEVRRLYRRCLEELNIHRNIPIYSTAFLKSPVITGVLKPCIYLPIHLISDYNESEMRHMLLHELQHYKHMDVLAGYLMNLAGMVYWFNPLVWYALMEMQNDREIACDASVLKMLEKEDYVNYGNTLINFAQKVSLSPFPFTAGLGGDMKQMRRRIVNIASYEKPTLQKRLKGTAAFVLTAALLLGFTPFISIHASAMNRYHWDTPSGNISYTDFSPYFGTYNGSFTFYDSANDSWTIYNPELATLRVSPDSTYKIYDALFGLEEGIIAPDNSFLAWNGNHYPFETWNADQTLPSAMAASVNWYFQEIDARLGIDSIYRHIQDINYGNRNLQGDPSTYWLESSLKISPVEQVELLTKLHDNSFGFAPKNIQAVKDALRLLSSDGRTLYAKTGTGCVDGKDVNGWFIGFIETADNAYFFATNLTADEDATGTNAAETTMSLLSDMGIWK